ncbi:lysosomal alpha-mannosidase, putative [Ixodes scapularis]|uniref:Lysosomal alpha-mannosidase, putative n=1 Tax=Ixodes scapularis TaxID=6945 RepID=B7PXG6_IXOSC|nr:lysosomal alpha-mannosidase, putative [Ixodes scapularis]|eukprot:XP_002400667.1 lysosomal alpha-mannosidase, putative [Ixodes scapularis]
MITGPPVVGTSVDCKHVILGQSPSPLDVRTILDSVVRELQANPERRFTYVEMGFFSRWWDDQSGDTRQLVRELVDAGE